MQDAMKSALIDEAEASELGGFWLRAGAMVIDQLLLMFAAGVAGAVIGVALALSGAPKELASFTGGIVGLAMSVAYYWGMVAAYGATFGKQWLGLRIVRKDGSPVSIWQALGRYVGMGISILPLGAGLLMVLFRRDKRALHDLMVDTMVIRVRK